ncbi:MAG: hypothetical protein ACRDPF_03055, partial [Streptosporangiaceae bacterium]
TGQHPHHHSQARLRCWPFMIVNSLGQIAPVSVHDHEGGGVGGGVGVGGGLMDGPIRCNMECMESGEWSQAGLDDGLAIIEAGQNGQVRATDKEPIAAAAPDRDTVPDRGIAS